MIRIKICGITNPEDAIAAVQSGADAIGLNFFSGSPRCLTVDAATKIAGSVPSAIHKVGVFVNQPADEILKIARSVPLSFIQLHGDESPEFLGKLGSFPIIRAWRVRDERSLDELFQYLERCRNLGREPDVLLIDAYQAGQYGGTGETLPWELLVRRPEPLQYKSLILAGGLRSGNVSHAIHTVRPDGVDVSSGVESQPGKKDEQLVRQFIEQAVAAFAAVTAG